VIESIELVGQFAPAADIDVFLLHLRRRPATGHSEVAWYAALVPGERVTLKDKFLISVGAVVPHRHKKTGPRRRYIHARILRPNTEFYGPAEFRRFKGTVVRPPFVVIRRTSRPTSNGDARVIYNLIQGSQLVAVENHLIVLRPIDGSVNTCRTAIKTLKSPSVTEWLDSRIRCRHLTVETVASIPFKES